MEGWVRVWRRPFLCCRLVAGVREVWPPPGGCRRKLLGFRLCSTPWAAKASLHSSGICCMCWAALRLSRRCVRPTGVAGVCCTAARRWVVRGVLLGEVGSPGVVVVYGRVHSCWCDVHRPALRWEEVIPQPSCPLLPCAWLVRDSRRACAAGRRHCRSCGRVRLRALGGFPRVAQGRCGGHCRLRAQGPRVPPGPPSQCGWRAAVVRPAQAPGSGGSRCSITLLWSSARPWAPRVWLAPLPGPSRIPYAGEEGQVG